MKPTRLVYGLLALCAVWTNVAAQAARAQADPKAEAEAAPKAQSNEQLRVLLLNLYHSVMSLEKKPNAEDGLPEPPDFEWMHLEEPKAETLLAIGSAQIRVGDIESARKSWQDALDLASSSDSTGGNEAKAKLLAKVAEAQADGGDREEALVTLRQAAQASRLLRSRAGRSLFPSPLEEDPAAGRAGALQAIGSVQAKAGDRRAASKTFQQAVEVASGIKNVIYRTYALVEIARAEDPTGGREAWRRTAQAALAIADEFDRAKSVDLVLRGLTELGRADEAIRLVNDLLKGDLQAFGVAVIAEELMINPKPAASSVIQSLREAAEHAPYDLRSKRTTVFSQLAILLARAGDSDGAYKALDAINPKNAPHRTNAILERLQVMTEIARHQLKTARKNEAKDTLQAALESIAPFQDDDGEFWLPVQDIVDLLARAGDPADAIAIAVNLKGRPRRIEALLAIARAQVERGDREGAGKTIDDAARAVDGIPNETLWSTLSLETRRLERQMRAGMARDFSLRMDLSNNKNVQYGALKDIAVARANAGDVARAIGTAKSIPTDDGSGATSERKEAFAAIAIVQAKAGDLSAALETAGPIPDDRYDPAGKSAALLKALASAHVKAGRTQQLMEWGGTSTSPATRLKLWRIIAESVAEKRAPEQDDSAPAQP